jgi:tRNA(Ile)-lysidine synthetase-like protein
VRQNHVDEDNGDDDHGNEDDDDGTTQPMILSRIQENQRLIQKVLNYWFGQYSPDESQKHLWMIAHSSQALRERVDQEITTEFQQLLLELSDGSLEEPSVRWKEWCEGNGNGGGGNGGGGQQQEETNKWLYGYQGKIAAIIVLDQFSRHMLRHYETQTESPLLLLQRPVLLPSKEHLDAWALHTAQLLAKEHVQEINCGMLPVPMYIFSLMPFRHANTIETVQLVQHRVEELASLNHQMEAMVGRFRKATNRRMAVLQDEARRSGGAREQSTCTNHSVVMGDGTNIMPKDEDILETFPFDADMGPATNHPCVKTIQDFLCDRGIRPNKKDTNDPTTIPIIVSLSGGVDSMVIASVLVHLRESCGYRLDLWAVHIDYANRPESGAEADFVRRYCERLGISFQIRRIDEVTRGVTARDDYERIARDLRYTSYRETIDKARNKKTKKGGREEETIGVMLGHHRGDLRENVLSNAHKGCGPLDLSGMTAVSRNDGVVIYRPLLPLEKTSIFDYAHKFGVPYFKGTQDKIVVTAIVTS